MRLRTLIVFLLALAVSLFAAGYRFGDSAHAMGMLSDRGGKARHPVILIPGLERYAVVVTATVLPPWRGNARVSVEGESALEWELHPAGPVTDLGLHRRPTWSEGLLQGLQPRDRLAFWLQLRRPEGACPTHAALPLQLTFRDAESDRMLLEVPIVFAAAGGESHGH